MNKITLCFLFFYTVALQLNAQDISARVTVDASRIGQSNRQVFEELNTSLNEFVNSTTWTSRRMKSTEKLKANFYLSISEYDNNSFKSTLQIQYSRPVYDAIYQSPMLMIKDNNVNFNYSAFEPLVLNKNNLDSNLVAVFAYYIYMMIGLDADSFSLNGGTAFYNEAKSIADLARSQNFSGWNASSSGEGRIRLSQDILSNAYANFRTAVYNYHRLGLDTMTENPKASKELIVKSINSLMPIFNRNSNAPLIKLFFDAKNQEIRSVFAEGPTVELNDLKSNLNSMAPIFSNYWNAIN